MGCDKHVFHYALLPRYVAAFDRIARFLIPVTNPGTAPVLNSARILSSALHMAVRKLLVGAQINTIQGGRAAAT